MTYQGMALALAMAGVALSAAPAAAETIYLKNGAQVKGTIASETKEAFIIEAAGGKKTINKVDIEQYPSPSPAVAFVTGMMLPGAGHIYTSMYNRAGGYQRAGLFLGLAALGGGGGFFLARQLDPTSIPLTVGLGVGLPTLVGAFDAWGVATSFSDKARFLIDYETEY